MMNDDERLIPVDIFDIYPYPDVQQGLGAPQNFLVLLKAEGGERVVPITIGHFEGQALAMAIRKIDMPRPLPHDLLRTILERMGASASRLVIHTLKDMYSTPISLLRRAPILSRSTVDPAMA